MYLLGAAGDKLIKSMGRRVEDGLPMAMHFSGDYTPCTACKEKYIGLIAVDTKTNNILRSWQVPIDTFSEWTFISAHIRQQAKEHGVLFMDEDTAKKLGLFEVTATASERDKSDG